LRDEHRAARAAGGVLYPGAAHPIVAISRGATPTDAARGRLERALARRRPCVLDLDDALYLETDGVESSYGVHAMTERYLELFRSLSAGHRGSNPADPK